jgi:hypothetical protein
MTKKINIILLGFNTLQEGIDYMQSSPYKFSFSFNGNSYDFTGLGISTPENSSVIDEGGIYVCSSENPSPGELYIENGFLQYYKEIA